MTERSVILKKKLEELESELADVFRLHPDPEPGPDLQTFVVEVHQRFNFLENLLSSEVASRPQDTDQLREIGERLARLEAAFRGWDKYGTLSSYLDDTIPVCSDCTQRLLNDEAEAKDVPGSDSSMVLMENFGGEKSPEECGRIEVSRRIWGKFGKYCGVFGSGAMIGAICMIKFSCLSDSFQGEAFLVPPT